MVLWKVDTTGYGPDAGPSNKGNESSDSVQFHDQTRECQFLKKKIIICGAKAQIGPRPPLC